MKKTDKKEKAGKEPRWAERLRLLMERKGLNPRSLSLKAGLNPTAVRDMLEGRVKYPRYDTVEGLAKALEITPAQLMSGEAEPKPLAANAPPESEDEDLGLLTEIISRLQETAMDYRHALNPQDFAAMVTTIYRQIKAGSANGKKQPNLAPKIQNLMDYDRLRRQGKNRES